MNLCEDIPTPDAAIDTESTASEESDVQIVKAGLGRMMGYNGMTMVFSDGRCGSFKYCLG